MPGPRKEVLSDSVTMWLGDCRDVLPLIGRVDAVVTDPPFGVNLTAKRNKWINHVGDGYLSTEDTPEFVREVCVPAINVAIGIARNVVITPGTRNIFAYPEPQAMGCIFNPTGAGAGRWGFECFSPVLYYGKDPYLAQGLGRLPNSWEQPANDYAEKNGHPCPKPSRMMMWLVNRSSLLGEIVCDPFMGSGSTGVACVNLGRSFIGIEIEPKYYDIARRRLLEALSQPRLPFNRPVKPKQETLLFA